MGPGRHGCGVSFLCPCCLLTKVFVGFENPIDGLSPIRGSLQRRRGEDFETLSLSDRVEIEWHGVFLVERGEVVEVL